MTTSSPLLDLADEVSNALNRAIAAKADDEEQRLFLRLTEDVQVHRARLTTASFVLCTPSLEVTAEERGEVESAVRALKASLSELRSNIAADPKEFRRGPSWIQFQATARALAETVEQVKQTAVATTIEGRPRPRPGLSALAVPGDPMGREYVTLSETYERLVGDVDSAEDLDAFIATARRLGEVAEHIEANAIPEEHLTLWRTLLGGRMRVTELTPEFLSWLAENGYAENVTLRYGQ